MIPSIQLVSEGLNRISPHLRAESDMAVSLLATNLLDELLFQLLEKYFIPGKAAKELFTSFGPLTSLSAKVKLTYSLGLISEDEYLEIETLRRIRNKFAHSSELPNFTHSGIEPLVKRLKGAQWLADTHEYLMDKSQDLNPLSMEEKTILRENMRNRFTVSAAMAILYLETAIANVSAVRNPPSRYPDVSKRPL